MKKMPVLFVGHGSPMNAIEDNEYTKGWAKMVENMPRPKAILVISAHWYTNKTALLGTEYPKMIYDMYGFPQELYEIVYPAKNDLAMASLTNKLLKDYQSIMSEDWGYDHGVWSILVKMYPDADIPVCELSINANLTSKEHYDIGVKLKELREQGVLIVGSGNIVHNLRLTDYMLENDGFIWAKEFDKKIKQLIVDNNIVDLINYEKLEFSKLAIPTPEHYIPLLYILGAANNDKVSIYNEAYALGSLSMTSYRFD